MSRPTAVPEHITSAEAATYSQKATPHLRTRSLQPYGMTTARTGSLSISRTAPRWETSFVWATAAAATSVYVPISSMNWARTPLPGQKAQPATSGTMSLNRATLLPKSIGKSGQPRKSQVQEHLQKMCTVARHSRRITPDSDFRPM